MDVRKSLEGRIGRKWENQNIDERQREIDDISWHEDVICRRDRVRYDVFSFASRLDRWRSL
jgi:hypothetical protein